MATQYTQIRPGAGQDREFLHDASDQYPSAKVAAIDTLTAASRARHNGTPVDHGRKDTGEVDSAGECHLNHVIDVIPDEFPDFVANDLFSDFGGGLDCLMGDDFVTNDYDFYSDAFGSLDGQLRGLERARATQ